MTPKKATTPRKKTTTPAAMTVAEALQPLTDAAETFGVNPETCECWRVGAATCPVHGAIEGPVPAAAGTFAIYEAPDGAAVLVLDVNGGTYVGDGRMPLGTSRLRIPGPIVKLIRSGVAGGKMPAPLRALMGRINVS